MKGIHISLATFGFQQTNGDLFKKLSRNLNTKMVKNYGKYFRIQSNNTINLDLVRKKLFFYVF